jgi:DNA polymerase V
MKILPILCDCGISGFQSPSADYQEIGLSLDELLINHPNATFIGKASGNSMMKVGIFSGDILIVDRALDATHGSIIVANLNGNFVCKILDKVNNRLLSASDTIPPVNITPDDVFQLEGIVPYSIRDFSNSINLAELL